MTHDELFVKIRSWQLVLCASKKDKYCNDCPTCRFSNALYDVVKLHKPNYGLCKACTTSVVHIPYPCHTIEAIQEKFK